MDFPLVLLVLLALPFLAVAVILGVSAARRRGRDTTGEPAHRAQADSAAVQDAAPTKPAPPRVDSGRERRAGSASASADGEDAGRR